MGIIAKDENQITLYYNSKTSLGKQTLGYVESSEEDVLSIDISKTKVTGTQWAEIANNLNTGIENLIDQDHPDFNEAYSSDKVDFEEHDWLRILEKTPSVLANPIIIHGNRTLSIKNPSDFIKFIENDSAVIEKPYNKDSNE